VAGIAGERAALGGLPAARRPAGCRVGGVRR
jgi:hypothetical protein